MAFDPADHVGAAIIVDERMMNGLIDRLHNGDPTLGWEGDPRLALVWWPAPQKWILARREGDPNEFRHTALPPGYSVVAISPPNLPFPGDIIQRLVEHDSRRNNVVDFVEAHNEKLRVENEKLTDEFIHDAVEKMIVNAMGSKYK